MENKKLILSLGTQQLKITVTDKSYNLFYILRIFFPGVTILDLWYSYGMLTLVGRELTYK